MNDFLHVDIQQYFTLIHHDEELMEFFVDRNRDRSAICSTKFHFFHCYLPVISTSSSLLSSRTAMLSCVLDQSVYFEVQASGSRCLQAACQLDIRDWVIQTPHLVSMYITKLKEFSIRAVL